MSAEWGGLGGLRERREFDEDNRFEWAVSVALGPRIREDREVASAMWGAMANVDWKHDGGDTALFSFRAAGDLIAAIRGEGNYMDWYCSGPYGVVPDFISEAMATQGWHWSACDEH